jgi:hypothetical protein
VLDTRGACGVRESKAGYVADTDPESNYIGVKNANFWNADAGIRKWGNDVPDRISLSRHADSHRLFGHRHRFSSTLDNANR